MLQRSQTAKHPARRCASSRPRRDGGPGTSGLSRTRCLPWAAVPGGLLAYDDERTRMDGKRFDDWARGLAAVRSRRATTRLLGGGMLAAALAMWGLRDAEAKNPDHKRGRLVARWLAAIQARRASGRPQGGGAFIASLLTAGRSDAEAKNPPRKQKTPRKKNPKTKKRFFICSGAVCTSQKVTTPSSVTNQNPR